jgi:hypothetical protein
MTLQTNPLVQDWADSYEGKKYVQIAETSTENIHQ